MWLFQLACLAGERSLKVRVTTDSEHSSTKLIVDASEFSVAVCADSLAALQVLLLGRQFLHTTDTDHFVHMLSLGTRAGVERCVFSPRFALRDEALGGRAVELVEEHLGLAPHSYAHHLWRWRWRWWRWRWR